MLANALMDASIAVWDAKVYYDSVRPVTAIRFLFGGRPVRAWAGPYQGTQLRQSAISTAQELGKEGRLDMEWALIHNL